MKEIRLSLCLACSGCLEVEMRADEVRIGETGNLAVLRKEEWNLLVDLIQSGELSKL